MEMLILKEENSLYILGCMNIANVSFRFSFCNPKNLPMMNCILVRFVSTGSTTVEFSSWGFNNAASKYCLQVKSSVRR